MELLHLLAMALQVLAAKEVEIGFDTQLRETFVKEAIILHQVSSLCACFCNTGQVRFVCSAVWEPVCVCVQ